MEDKTTVRTYFDIQFEGKASEFFNIWIVNVLLTIVTLGIYSAWAKVRTNQYFYGSTYLDGSSFQYTADPIKILKGRLLVVFFILAYQGISQIYPTSGSYLFLITDSYGACDRDFIATLSHALYSMAKYPFQLRISFWHSVSFCLPLSYFILRSRYSYHCI